MARRSSDRQSPPGEGQKRRLQRPRTQVPLPPYTPISCSLQLALENHYEQTSYTTLQPLKLQECVKYGAG